MIPDRRTDWTYHRTFAPVQTMRSERELVAAAEYMGVHLYPQEIRPEYVEHIRVQYLPDSIIPFLLQGLSEGMTNLFYGLLANYLSAKTKEPDPKLVDIERLLQEQRDSLVRLEALLSQEKDPKWAERARIHQQFQERTMLQIQESDPAIAAMVEDVLRQLEARGENALLDDVDASGPWRSDRQGT